MCREEESLSDAIVHLEDMASVLQGIVKTVRDVIDMLNRIAAAREEQYAV